MLVRDPYGAEGVTSSLIGQPNGDAAGNGWISAFLSGDPIDSSALFNMISLISGPILIADGVDYTRQYVDCLNRSGYAAEVARSRTQHSALYDVVTAGGDRSQTADPGQTQANNRWAVCARDQGWLVLDSTSPGEGWPEEDLPSSITVDQLRSLLALCLNFDADKQKSIDEWMWDHNGTTIGYPHQEDLYTPQINFWLSPLDAAYLSILFTDAGRPFFAHLMSLYTVLNEQRMSYVEHSLQ